MVNILSDFLLDCLLNKMSVYLLYCLLFVLWVPQIPFCLQLHPVLFLNKIKFFQNFIDEIKK